MTTTKQKAILPIEINVNKIKKTADLKSSFKCKIPCHCATISWYCELYWSVAGAGNMGADGGKQGLAKKNKQRKSAGEWHEGQHGLLR